MKAIFALGLILGLSAASPILAACTRPADAATRITTTIADINTYRKTAGLAALAADDKLTKAAANHACDMASMGKFSHFGSNGSDLVRRLKDQGYGFRSAVENVGKFKASTAAAGWWYNSAGHRANMLSPKISDVGLGLAMGSDKQLYWVMVGGSTK